MCVYTGRFRCALEVFIMVAWYSLVYLVVFPLPPPPTIMGVHCCVCLFVYQFVYVLTSHSIKLNDVLVHQINSWRLLHGHVR